MESDEFIVEEALKDNDSFSGLKVNILDKQNNIIKTMSFDHVEIFLESIPLSSSSEEFLGYNAEIYYNQNREQ